MDPIFEEMARAREVQPHALRRWVDYLRNVIQPQLDELAMIKADPLPQDATTKKATR